MMYEVIEQRCRKIESEELIRMFPINTVIDTQKVIEENKDHKRFSFLYN